MSDFAAAVICVAHRRGVQSTTSIITPLYAATMQVRPCLIYGVEGLLGQLQL